VDNDPMKLRYTLNESLGSLLDAMQNGHFPEQTSPLDILFAYRLLLLRSPEELSAPVLQQRAVEFPSIVHLSRGFMSSTEFRNKYYGISQRDDGRTVIVRCGLRRIAVSLDDHAIGWQIINGTYEPELDWIIGRLVNPGDVCVDVGANVGYFTSLFGTLVGPEGHVFAYEPFAPICRLLRITVEETKIASSVTVIEKACSDRCGSATLLSAAETDNFGGAHLASETSPVLAGLDQNEVEIVTLDDSLASVPTIAFVKMDVEGVELSALRGFRKRIQSDRPVMVLEVNRPCLAAHGVQATELFAFLRQAGYSMYNTLALFEQTAVQTLDEQSFDCLGEVANICAVHDENRDAVLARMSSADMCQKASAHQ
jgi:FkbM family methyltransferase